MASMETENKRVGVFMKVYRNEESMHQAIQSVLNQTYSNIRFYVLVSEETKPVFEQYVQKDARVVLLDGEGPKDGFRTRAKQVAAENDYITVIDADDWYVANYVQELVQIAEKEKADMVACGNYYFTGENKINAERKQSFRVWETSGTNMELPYIYGHFRTIWGKLIASHVLLNCNFGDLPDQREYGGYGGDTLLMFNLFPYTSKLCVSDKTLYYYRMSESSTTYKLTPGRLDSDEVLFHFIEGVLKRLGEIGEFQKRFLFWIYGNAVADTIKLLLYTNLSQEERTEKLLYILKKPLTLELFMRENRGMLNVSVLGAHENYMWKIYQLLFSDMKRCTATQQIRAEYLEMLEIIFPDTRGWLELKEFEVLLKHKALLDAFANKKVTELTEMLLVLLKALNTEERTTAMQFMRKITSDVLMKKVLKNADFAICYTELLRTLGKKQYEDVFNSLHSLFSSETLPDYAEELVELWITVAASVENAAEFILAKQLKVELLVQWNQKSKAVQEFDELINMGIDDENMEYLRKLVTE